MRLFDRQTRTRNAEHRRIYAFHVLARTINNFVAAALFVVGSILFGLWTRIKRAREFQYPHMVGIIGLSGGK